MSALVVNIFGGPGAGKSGVAAGVYSLLRRRGLSCELVRERAKEYVWSRDHKSLNNQVLVTAEQFDRVLTLHEEVDCIVNDSPILIGLVYPTPVGCTESWRRAVYEHFSCFNNTNFYLFRTQKYEQKGRREDEPTALKKDLEIQSVLAEFDVKYESLTLSGQSDTYIADCVLAQLNHAVD